MWKWLAGVTPLAWVSTALVAVVLAVSLRWLHEHDERIRAADHAQQIAATDAAIIQGLKAASDAAARRVDTVILAAKTTIQPTKEIIRQATEHIHDTTIVKAALDSSAKSIQACSDALNSCESFKVQAKQTRDSLIHLLFVRDSDRVNRFTPPKPPRMSHGIQTTVGYCIDLQGRRAPCATIGYGFQLRFP